jgi:hypothetical protein
MSHTTLFAFAIRAPYPSFLQALPRLCIFYYALGSDLHLPETLYVGALRDAADVLRFS